MEKIIFIGMPGSGKTTIGKEFSYKINYKFYDLDEYIEKKINMKIATIFSKYGENYFREIENKFFEELILNMGEKSVISTGGGIVENKKNFELLKNNIVIFIDRELSEIEKMDHTNRPLLKDINNLKKIYNKRINLYKEYSNFTIKNNETIENVISTILKLNII